MDTFCCPLRVIVISVVFCLGCTSCATQQSRQGANIGAITGATAGALLDSDNPWRGAVIGGSLGTVFGGALRNQPTYYGYQNTPSCYTLSGCSKRSYLYTPQPRYEVYGVRNNAAIRRGAALGGVTGAAAGTIFDHGNPWRGGLIGGVLGGFFGGSTGSVNLTTRIPILQP